MPKFLHQRYLLPLLLVSGICSVTLALKAAQTYNSRTVDIPKPAVALKQADQLSPPELTQLEVDEVIRDRLRSDPEWQAIANSIRQEIIILKWGDGKLTNPVWQRYGAKAFPLLDYYTRTKDRTRQEYGIAGIVKLGKPYTTLWLEKQIKRRLNIPDFYSITENPDYLLTRTGEYSNYESKDWEKRFGLDDPTTRDRIVKLAWQNLESPKSSNYYEQFNLQFLQRVLGYEAVNARYSGYDGYRRDDSKPFADLPNWLKFERLSQPTPEQIQKAIAYFRNLPEESKEYILVDRLGALKAEEITPFARAFFRTLISDKQSSGLERNWAILELDRHNNAEGTKLLKGIINGDLRQLHPLTKVIGYENDSKLNFYGYYLLLGITTKYPKSKFTQACREYGDLIGKSYFDGQPRSKAILDRNAKMTPDERIQAWQNWLSKYPGHPGADDATYLLSRALQNKDDIMSALRLWVKMMTQPMGDRDALYLAWPHIRTMLDVGLTTDQVQTLRQEPAMQPIEPLLTYALAVRAARSQNYSQALALSQNLNLTTMPESILGTYYNATFWWREEKAATIQAEMQKFLTEQRQRWQQLLAWQQENTPIARYRLASNWADVGGWKNGYLPLWNGYRTYYLPTGTWGGETCEIWWTCNLKQKSMQTLRENYRSSSQNAVAISLYQSLLNDANTPADLREKALFMVASTLLEQWEEHTVGETEIIHPPAGVTTSPIVIPRNSYESYEAMEKQIQLDYQRRIDSIIGELQLKFPQSNYTDDLLFSSFFLTKEPRYLKRLVEKYPNSDRVAEAKYLLEHYKPQSDH